MGTMVWSPFSAFEDRSEDDLQVSLFFIYLFIYLFCFLGLHLQHTEVPRLGVELEL